MKALGGAHEIHFQDDCLIPEGRYQAVGGRGSLFHVFTVPKLMIPWTVAAPTLDGMGRVVVPGFYNATFDSEGRLRVGKRSKFLRDVAFVTGRRPSAGAPVSLTVFEAVLVEIEVRTVAKDSKGNDLPKHARYSVVERLLRLLAGGRAGC